MDGIGALGGLLIWGFLVLLVIWAVVLPAAAVIDILVRRTEVAHPAVKVVALVCTAPIFVGGALAVVHLVSSRRSSA